MVLLFQSLQLRITFEQQAVAEPVKRSQAYGTSSFAGRFGDPVLHFRRCFVGERQAEDRGARKFRIAGQQVPDALGDDTCFARAGARHHQ